MKNDTGRTLSQLQLRRLWERITDVTEIIRPSDVTESDLHMVRKMLIDEAAAISELLEGDE